MSRHRSSSKRSPPEIGLHMECVEEELEPSQIAYYNKAEKEYNDVQSKLDNYIKKMKAEVVEKGENCVVLQVNATPPTVTLGSSSTPTTGGKGRQSVQATQNYQPIVGQGIITRSSANSAGNTYLVMDPRLSFVVGQMPPASVTSEQPVISTTPKAVSTGRTRQTNTSGSMMVTTRAKSGLKKQSAPSDPEIPTPPVTRTREKAKNQVQNSPSQASTHQSPIFTTATTASSPGSYKIKVNAKQTAAPSAPNECNALGGLSAGTKTPWKPPTDEASGSKTTADSREVTFSRLTGKIFPSLVVIARPHLKLKYIHQSNIQQERTALDARVKGVLMYTTTKFIEWLIQQGLIRSEQYCQTHVRNDQTPVPLKLGMYSDVTKFPYSGGYVWISDCCPSQFVSVFSGSLFEGAPHPPTVLLKLIYHWACQTNVQNVVQWVKVDNLYLKNFYTNMRAVCTQAVYEKFKRMGGPRKKIEVGVISLGTTSQDGNKRQVKVEVLGVLDQENKLIRLRAVEPLSEERSFKKRFIKILEPLKDWVNKESAILTDFTVAKAALNAMGFQNVFQVNNDSKHSNHNIMEYLRRIVPRMFQNTLSLLSRQIIQQFLDELVWREMWGPIPSQAFVNIISHLAEQTKLDVPESFSSRLNKVAANPFKRWDYATWKPISLGTRSSLKAQQKLGSPQESLSEVPLESSETPTTPKGIRTRKRAAEAATPPVSAKKIPKLPLKEKLKKEEKVPKKEEKILKKEEKIPKKEKESCDKLSDEVIKFLNNDENKIPLETYYYGSKKGEDSNQSSKGAFFVKCSVCNKRFTENIVLMKHMILHCQTEPLLVVNLKKVHQCDYCFLGFNTNVALKQHLEEVHSVTNGKLNSNLICHICEEKFKSRNDLVYHMHRWHVELEMPYECGACHFRTSVYKVFVDHFTRSHKGEDHVFCPYCLKVVTFSYKGEAISLNVLFYMAHLEKHQRLTLVKDCNRCQLSFIHKGILDQHLEVDHGSWKNESGGVRPIKELPDGIFMPAPGNVIKPANLAPPPRIHKPPKTKNMFAVNKFKALEIYGVDDDMACVECEASLMNPEHFSGNFNCLKCRYASCCETATVEHFAIFHESSHPQFTKGKPIDLPQEMFCVCGYSSSSGNRIAKHLALCERKSAYSSKETAAANIVSKPDTDSDEKLKQGEGQNVLNMLGLFRKSPETATAGSDPMKMEVDEEAPPEAGVKQETNEVDIPDSSSQEETESSESQQECSVVEAKTQNVAHKTEEKDDDGKAEDKCEDSKDEKEMNEVVTVEDVPSSSVMENEQDLPKSEDKEESAMDITEEKGKDEAVDIPETPKNKGEDEEQMEVDEIEGEKETNKEEANANIQEQQPQEESCQNEDIAPEESRMEIEQPTIEEKNESESKSEEPKDDQEKETIPEVDTKKDSEKTVTDEAVDSGEVVEDNKLIENQTEEVNATEEKIPDSEAEKKENVESTES